MSGKFTGVWTTFKVASQIQPDQIPQVFNIYLCSLGHYSLMGVLCAIIGTNSSFVFDLYSKKLAESHKKIRLTRSMFYSLESV